MEIQTCSGKKSTLCVCSSILLELADQPPALRPPTNRVGTTHWPFLLGSLESPGWGTQMAGINQKRSKLFLCAPRPAARNCTLFLSSTGFGRRRRGWMASMHKASRCNGRLLLTSVAWRWQRCIWYQAANETAMQVRCDRDFAAEVD